MTHFVDVERRAPSRRARETRAKRVDAGRLIAFAALALANAATVALGGSAPPAPAPPPTYHCEGYRSDYDNSYCTGHGVCGRGTITNEYIITRKPSGPGASACSTWSQTKDCAVTCAAPTVTFGNSQRVISSNTFDFKVQVMHAKLCPNENCLTSLAATRDRIKCKVEVKKVGQACSSYGAHLPCLKWDDFKGDLSLTTVDGSLVAGDYKITYDCHAVSKPGDYKYDTYGKEVVSAKAEGSVTFEIVAGCNAVMPAGAGGSEGANSELVKLFLLGSDEFVQAPCAAIADTKENIFRRFDVSPTDGELSFDELVKAAKDRSTDAYILKLWNSMESVRLTLGQVVKSRVRPIHCPSVTDDADATFDAVVYPTSESGRETTTIECQASAMSASAQWSFDATKVPGRNQGENVCVYVDGVLFEAHEPSTAAPTDASRYTRYDTTGKYALTKIVDKRPVSGGIDDVQSFIAAQFTFDGVRHDGSTIPSNVKLGEDDASAQPTLKSHDGAMMQSSWFPICYGLHGGYCMYSKPGGYKYAGEALEHGGFAFSTWFRVANKNDFSKKKKNNDYVSENTIISLKSDIDAVLEARAQRNGVQDKSGSGSQATEEVDEHELRMFGKTIGVVSDKKVQLVVEYTVKKSGGVKSTIATVNVEYTMRTWNDWYLVGFTYSNKGGLRVFSYPAGSDAKHTTQLKTWPKDKLAFTPNIVLFDTKQASTFEVDDARLYTGDLNPSTFLSARSCGRYGYCANRALATPVNRRVVCVFAHNKGVAGSYECAGMMYYDGSVIDLRPSMDMAGVIFAFRDTSWAETSFEIERKEYGNGGKFETVVLVEGDLKGCAAMFASITYIDREASMKPNSRWMYRVTTKTGSLNEETGLSYIVSPTYSFTTPWIGEVEGRVLAGESVAPVPHVRICAEFDKYIRHGRNADSFDETASAAIIYDHNLAKYKRATHSVKNLTSNAYVVTDGAVDESALSVAHGEHVRVDLGAWHSIGSIKVCVSAESSSLPAVVPYVSDADPDIPGVSDGHACVFSEHTNGCSSFRCVGASLKSLHGQHVTVRASSPTSITEIQVLGNHTRCAFSAVSDKDGEYHIDVKDSSGTMPSKAQLHVGAYKEEVFSITNVTLIESMKSARDQADVPVPRSEPKDVLLTLREQEAQKPLPKERENVEWTSMHNVVSPAANELKGDDPPNNRNPFATSVGTIASASDSKRGIMAAMRSKSSTWVYPRIGLEYRAPGSTATTTSRNSLDFAIMSRGDHVWIYEKGVFKGGGWLRADEKFEKGVLKVVLNENSTGVNYFVNDRLLRSTVLSAPMQFPLVARVFLWNEFGHFEKVGWVVDGVAGRDDVSSNFTRHELSTIVEKRLGFGDVGHVVVPDASWSSIDTDGDGVLSAAEIFEVRKKFETRQLYVEPSLVYPSRDVKYAFGIQMHQSADDPSNNSTAGPGREVTSARACERVVFLRQAKVERPKSRQDWESIYDAIFGSEDASAAYDCVALSNATRDVIHVGDKESAAALPVVAFAPGTNKIMLDSESITRYAVAAERAEDVFNIVTRDGFRLRVTAQEQMPDIVHSFDKPPVRAPKKTDSTETDAEEKIFSDQVFTKVTVLNAQHKRVEEKDFTDDTTAIVKGAVLFPKHLVEGSTECGVLGATIEVLESDGEPEEYETDAQGQFEIAVTRGKTFKFLAKLKGHTLCYAGTSVQDAVDRTSACSQTDSVDVTLTNAGDGNTLYFVDSTIRNIDLGLYAGECNARYAGATFKITPANGCHPSAYRTSAEIAGWKFATSPETHPHAKSAEWPYAAMDYTVTLHTAPSNAGFLELKQAESWSDGCAGGDDDGDMLKYFRARDTLVRSVPMLAEHDFVQIRYKYHGYICVEVLDIPKIDDDEETCYDPQEPKGGLTRRHFLGSSEYFGSSIPDVVDFRARAFEIHLGELHGEKLLYKCAKFPSEATKTGSTVLSFRQTVTDEANNPCHPNRGGAAECDFQPVAESEGDVGLISWPRSDGSLVQYKGVETGQPNLAGNRRRFLEVTVTRSDDASVVKTSVTRNLIPLGSKPRDGGGEGDDTFWATVPIEGLVYTVVHDPPGGDSYAELAVGSTIGMEFDISGTRSASSNKDRERKQEKGTGVETDPGFSGGWIVEAGVNFPINWLEMKLALESEEKGPKIEMKSSNQTGWSLSAQTDRVIRSSQDAANPGRSGDAILGGGIELVYKLSDVLDVVDDLRTQNTPCLFISQAITWLPRKPTSYVFGVVSIETQILPNLKFLLTTTRSPSNKVKDESGMYYPCGDDDAVATGNESISLCSNADVRAAWTNYLVRSIDTWRRTLAWSSPSVYMTQGGGGGKSKDYSQIERISAPMTDDERTPFGNNFAAGAEMFKAEFSRPMDDVMDELANTWDATFWMMPYNGLGPPPMAGDARVFSLFGDDAAIWDLDRRYWEPDQDDGGEGEATGREEFRDEWSWQITGEDPPDDGDARSDGVDSASDAAESLLRITKSMMGGAKRKNHALNTAKSIGKDFLQNMYKNKKAAEKLKESVEDALADKSASAKAWRSVKRGGSSVANTAGEAAKKLAKAKNTVAGKMLIAGVVAGAAAAAYAASDSGYHYVSFPRQHYKQFTPTHADTFYDFDKSSTGNAAAYGSGMLVQSTFDLVENFQSCAGYECGEGEFENSAESMLSDVDGDGEISWLDTNALGEDMRISFSDGAASDRLVASFTGGQARAGMRLRGADPKEPTEETLLLTFTGGGHSMDYAYATSEKTSDNHYAIGMSLSGEWSNKYDLGLGGIIGLVVSVGMALGGLDTAAKSTFAKEIGIDRSFAWNKHGSLSTLYTLGDPELGDKFVVQVASDTRFGTPVFMTLGGRSLCPGEAQTVFREAGYTLELATTANERLNPGDRAVLHVLLNNDSPYREATTLGLQLIDGLTQSVSDVISAAYAVLDDLRATGQEVSDAVSAAASSSIAKDSDVVKKMVADALASANAGASAIDVAASVVKSSKSAPNTGFEMDDAAFTIGGEEIIPNGDVFPFKFIGGDGLNVQKREAVTQFTLAVTPEVARARSMKYLVLRVLSLCEFTFWDNWRHAGTPIGHQIWMGEMSWSSNCPIASFNQATVDAYEFTTVLQSAQTLALSVYNPDRENLWPSSATPRESSNARLSKVYVQYRSKQGGEWITATDTTSSAKKNLLCDYSRDGGCEFGWSVKSLPEGDYDVRVKTFCTGSDVFASPDVRERVDEKMLQLRVDRTPPVEKGFSFDTMGERVLWVQFFEDIDCSNAKVSLRKTRTDSCESADDAVDTRASDFVISCRNAGSQGSWIMKYPSTLAGVYEGVLTGVTDIAGNEADTYTFSFGTTSAARECPKVIGAKRAALSTLGVADAPTDASFAAEERSTSFEPTSVALFATTFLAGALSACALFAIARRLSAVSTPQDAVRDERASIKSTSVLPSYGATV